MNQFVKEKVRVTLENLEKLTVKSTEPIQEWKYIPCDYKTEKEPPKPDDSWSVFGRNDRVQGMDRHFWFYTEIKTPALSENEEVYFQLTTGHEGEWFGNNAQGILYLNGQIAHGLDLNHRKVILKPDTEYKIHLYFYVGMKEHFTDVKADIKIRDIRIQNLYYDMKVPYDAALCFEAEDYAYLKTMKHLDAACNLLDFRGTCGDEAHPIENFYAGVAAADKYLHEEYFAKECGNSDAVISYVGHTHIDVAWLWTLAQTREKAQHSFATVLALMDRYPEYIFMSSQPQLYEYLKEEAPDLYEKVKERVREGRWEVEGAMWLEADCNLSSGESLIRQILYGKGFMKEEFGVDSKVLWLPDVFGYSAALPQILKKSGVNKFVTSKISWSETNRMPYDTFLWSGIDGTEIFTYFMTAQNHVLGRKPITICTYNGNGGAAMALGTWERYQQKDVNNETLVTFGFGDGGGGPTEEMIEAERRLEYGLPGLPKARMSRAGDFLDRVEENFTKGCELSRRTPRWVGELYLEFHRGTYTSMARNKKNNRQCEFLCQTTEALSVMDKLLMGGDYPETELHESWKLLLLNQFHDIIPGSSIYEVYEDSDRDYAKVRSMVGTSLEQKLQKLADNQSAEGILVYNPNSFSSTGYVDFEGDKIYAEDVPAFGWKVIAGAKERPAVNVSERRIENDKFILSFGEDYTITSIWDKEGGREVLVAGGKANLLRAYEDYPKAYDNWEISNYYKDKSVDIDYLASVSPISGNGFGGFEIVRKYGASTIRQRILLYSGSRRIDFENDIDWHEKHTVVKALFPVDIHANKATYEIQFGHVERTTHENTSWDAAQFEVCAQKWADLSENGYGVSILNDCKYGHAVEGNEMSITLLKCGTYPNPEADQGRHTFTYSLYPHTDGFAQAGTIDEAYLLNRPMTALKCSGKPAKHALPSQYSLINCDCENIVIETVKQAENGNGIIIRLYDAWNRKSQPTLKLGFNAKKISLCDMMENPISEIGSGSEVTLPVKNFEIVTLLIEVLNPEL